LSKTILATCQNGIVTGDETPIDGAHIFSEGVAESEGVAILDADKVFYFAKTSPDLKTTLEKLIAVLGQISSGINSLDTRGFLIGATGAVVGPPALSGTVSQINTIKSQLETLKDSLK